MDGFLIVFSFDITAYGVSFPSLQEPPVKPIERVRTLASFDAVVSPASSFSASQDFGYFFGGKWYLSRSYNNIIITRYDELLITEYPTTYNITNVRSMAGDTIGQAKGYQD